MAEAVRPNARKQREGVVSSTSMDKTAVVVVTDRVRHPLYGKTMLRSGVKAGDRIVTDGVGKLHDGDTVESDAAAPATAAAAAPVK